MNISLEISDRGTPYIEMYDYGRLIFSKVLLNKEGYKWLCYQKRYENRVNISGDKDNPRYVTIPEYEAIVYTFKLYREIESIWGVKKGTIPKKIQTWFRKTFKEFGVEKDGVLFFPSRNIPQLAEKIEKTDFDKILKPPKKRKKKK
jgi:hypothetical protein